MEAVGIVGMGTADVQISRAFAYAAMPAVWGTPTYAAANLPNIVMRVT